MWTAAFTAERDIKRLDDTAMAQVHARRRQAEGGGDIDVLEVRGVNAGYGNVQILFDVDFHVRSGEVVALLGTNGAGKSTLLRVISGLLTPTTGTILLDGEDITGLDTELTAQRGVIQVPGGRGVFPGLSVARNLELGTYLYWNEPDYVAEAQRDVLELFPRLAERMKQPAGTLSGGEQQMLTLAQSLMSKPRILMIDELSLGLAPIVVQELLVAVRKIAARGTPIVLVEQSVNIAMTLADRAYFLEKGEVRFEGQTRELMERGDLLRSIFLEGAGSKMGSGA
jgi:branched-chain amino acid transport system ATP-binding protein